MIDIKRLKKEKSFFINSFKNKGLDLKKEVEQLITLYDDYKKLLSDEQILREQLNKQSNLIKQNPKDSSLIEKAKKISLKASKLKDKISKLDLKIKDIASPIPNILKDDVPLGKSEKDNKIISTHFDSKKANKYSKPHWEIIEEKKMILQKESSLISGTRHVIYNGKAALLIKAIEKFMIDNAVNQGFNIIEPPVLVNKESLYNTGQLPKFEDDLFKVGNQYLIPTAEVPLTNLVANKLLIKEDLPLNFVASTNCFRKEAGSAGKDTRGLIRLHQFRKVELVTIGKIEDEEKDFNKILKTATSVLDKLELPYRLVQLCSGDTSFSSQKTIDIEVWMPGIKEYKEVSSISFIGDFQARRMKTRYKDEKGNKYLVNTFNGSSLAIGRTMAAIVENYIQASGMIKVPKVLEKYLTFKEI